MSTSTERLHYPVPRRDTYVDTYHGHEVPDPYQWMEDPDSEETKSWVKQQVDLTESVLERCELRKKIKDRISELYDYPKYKCPWKEGDNYFFFKNDGLQNHFVLYLQWDLKGEAQVFFDPNTLSSEGDISLNTYSFSESGKYFAYGLSQRGSDWITIHIKTVPSSTSSSLPSPSFNETIEWVKFSGISWTHDDVGFFYSRYPASTDQQNKKDDGTNTKQLQNHQIFYHRIGTPQEQDVLIYAEPTEPSWNFGAEVTDDGKYVCVISYKDCDPVNKFFYYKFPDVWQPQTKDPILPVTKLIDTFEAEYSYITNFDRTFYFKTNKNAPRYKVISIDLNDPSSIREILPETKDVLSFVSAVDHDKLLVVYIREVVDVLELYSIKGEKLYTFPLPSLGTISSVKCRKKSSELFYQFASFLSPGTIFHYNFDPKVSDSPLTLFRESEIKGYDANLYKAEQYFVPSKDGTKIPIFVVSKKSVKKDGKNPVWLYAYGGFNASMQPYFSVVRLVWIQHLEGVFVLANLRGGGEYGEEWHQAGTKHNKQNVFDDFQATAEYLVREGYTVPELITINGDSNGGLLIGACINQRPELFGCAVAGVGVMDMLKFHKFTIGHFWVSEYGSSDDEEGFQCLMKYSPLHNVRKGKPYPAVLLTTADHDDRVSPLHSFKLMAELQHQLGNETYQMKPLIIRIEVKAGHGSGKPTTKIIAEHADSYAFVSKQLGLKWAEGERE